MTDLVDLDWENLGFDYMELPYRYRAHYKDGQWHKAGLTEDATIAINEGSPVFHYGQAAFEGLKRIVVKMVASIFSGPIKMQRGYNEAANVY